MSTIVRIISRRSLERVPKIRRDKSSLSGHTPIVQHLWLERQRIAEAATTPAVKDGEVGWPAFTKKAKASERNKSGVLVKTPADSSTSVRYSFSSDAALVEQYEDFTGHIRLSRVFEDLDALAGTIAFKHCADPESAEYQRNPLQIVTNSVDRVVMSHRANLKDDMVLSGVCAAGSHTLGQSHHCQSCAPFIRSWCKSNTHDSQTTERAGIDGFGRTVQCQI